MGPRSNDRGNVLGGELGYWLKALLQWGRDQMIAEIAWSPNPWLSKSCGQHCERSRRPLIRLIAHPTSSDAKLSVFNRYQLRVPPSNSPSPHRSILLAKQSLAKSPLPVPLV